MAAVAISFFMFVPFRRMAPLRSRIMINSAVDGVAGLPRLAQRLTARAPLGRSGRTSHGQA